MSQTWIASTWVALRLGQYANTFTLVDSQISDVFGPAAVLSGGLPAGNRVDILIMSRITMNQGHPSANATVVWIDIGTFDPTHFASRCGAGVLATTAALPLRHRSVVLRRGWHQHGSIGQCGAHQRGNRSAYGFTDRRTCGS